MMEHKKAQDGLCFRLALIALLEMQWCHVFGDVYIIDTSVNLHTHDVHIGHKKICNL